MSTTHSGLTFKRFTRQVRTEMTAVLATSAAAHQAETLLKSAPWVEQSATQGTFPARNALQDGFSGTWDAFKHVGNYAAGYQRAYAGMVAYRFQLPADASGKDVVSVDVPLYVDRWLVDGVRVAAYLSDDTTPATAWDTLRTGDANEDAQLPMTYTEDVPPLRVVVEKNVTITVTFPGSTAAADYLWVVVSLEDYTTSRDFWIEGAALILGETVEATFSAAVTADAVIALPPTEREILESKYLVSTGPNVYAAHNFRHVAVVDEASIGLWAGLLAFPTAGGTETQFDADDGAIIGYSGTTADEFSGVVLCRIIQLAAGQTYTRLRFGGGALLSLAVKEFSARMTVWSAPIAVADSDPVEAGFLTLKMKADVSGYRKRGLWRGYTSPATVLFDDDNGLSEDREFEKIGEVVLAGRNYTDEDVFTIALTGSGMYAVVVCIAPESVWAATAGTMSTANAVFTPGSSIYLS